VSTALLNQLFEEAGERSSEMAARAAAAATAAGMVVEEAKALGQKAVDEAERLHKEYTETINAVTHAREQAGQAAVAASEAVESVTPEILKAAQALDGMLMGMEGDLGHLGQERARLLHELNDSAHQAETDFHELAAKVGAFDEHLHARMKEAADQLEHFQQVLKLATAQLDKAREHLYEEMDILGRTAASVSDAAAEGMEAMLAAVASGLLDFSNNAITGHNEVAAAVRHGYLDESKADAQPAETYFDGIFEKITDALHLFEEVPEPVHSALQSALAAVLEPGEKAVNGLMEVGQSLDHSAGVVTS